MSGNMGLHVMKNPAGTFSYVGTIPANLGKAVVATMADIMGGRAQRNPHTGEAMVLKFPVFKTRKEAIHFASFHGHNVVIDS